MRHFKHFKTTPDIQEFELARNDLQWTVGITNSSGTPVTVKTHYGLNTSFTSTVSAFEEHGIWVSLTMRIRTNVLLDIFSLSIEDLPPEYKVFQEALFDKTSKSNLQLRPMGIDHYSITVSFFYERQWLEDLGGQTYLPLADIVISFIPIENTMSHPRTVTAHIAADLPEDEGHVYLQLELIDRHDRFGCYYTNLKGDIYKLTPTTPTRSEDTQPDGLYITSSKPDKYGRLYNRKRPSKFIPVEELIKDPTVYGLYRTRSEAISFGGKDIDAYCKKMEAAEEALGKLQTKHEKAEEDIRNKDYEIKRLRRDISKLEHKVKDNDRVADNIFMRLIEIFKIVGGWFVNVPKQKKS